MTKKEVILFARQYGLQARYSGKERMWYFRRTGDGYAWGVISDMTIEELEREYEMQKVKEETLKAVG